MRYLILALVLIAALAWACVPCRDDELGYTVAGGRS